MLLSVLSIAVCISGTVRDDNLLRHPAVVASIKDYRDHLAVQFRHSSMVTFLAVDVPDYEELRASARAIEGVGGAVRVNRTFNGANKCNAHPSEKHLYARAFRNQAHKMKACYDIVRKFEEKNGYNFTHFVRLRPDVEMVKPFAPLRVVNENEILVNSRTRNPGPYIGDHFAFMSRTAAVEYFNQERAWFEMCEPASAYTCHEPPDDKGFGAECYMRLWLEKYRKMHLVPIRQYIRIYHTKESSRELN